MLQNVHGYGLSPVCIGECFDRALLLENTFPHTRHTNGLTWLPSNQYTYDVNYSSMLHGPVADPGVGVGGTPAFNF